MVSTRRSARKSTVERKRVADVPVHKAKAKKVEKKNAKKKALAKTEKKAPKKITAKKVIEKKKIPEKKIVEKRKKNEKRDVKVAKPAGSSYSGYTPDQYTKFVNTKKILDESSVQQLKEMCKTNGQKVTGTKPELIERVADGKILGAIPKCNSCGGGRPKWDAKTANYRCPGYMEDSDFIFCNKKFAFSEIQRTPWQL